MSDTTPSLPRRMHLGAELAAEAPVGARGVRVARVLAHGTALAAGVEEGDEIAAIDGAPVTSMHALRRALRDAGARAALTIVRGARTLERTVDVVRRPEERLDGHVVEYGAVRAGDARRRTIATFPRAPGRRPAVLFVQGLGARSIELEGDTPLRRLVAGWADAALVTMRVEKRGVGDSDGDDEGDLEHERAGVAAALEALRRDPRVDANAIVVFGHSVGGMIAPLLEGVAGRVVFGTSCDRWFDCLAAGTARQLALRGEDADAIARAVDEERRALAATLDPSAHEGPYGRAAGFHRQLQSLDLAAAWSRAGGAALVVHGEWDWVVGEDEAARIVAACGEGAAMAIAPGLDHAMTRHPTRDASMRALGRGALDDALARATAAWIRALAAARM